MKREKKRTNVGIGPRVQLRSGMGETSQFMSRRAALQLPSNVCGGASDGATKAFTTSTHSHHAIQSMSVEPSPFFIPLPSDFFSVLNSFFPFFPVFRLPLSRSTLARPIVDSPCARLGSIRANSRGDGRGIRFSVLISVYQNVRVPPSWGSPLLTIDVLRFLPSPLPSYIVFFFFPFSGF